MTDVPQESPRTTLAAALLSFRSAFAGIGLVSAIINILALTGSFFMLQVYDRAVPSSSVPTLVGLGMLATFLYAFQGILELIRSRLLVRIGVALDLRTSGSVYIAMMRLPLHTKLSGDGLQSFRDLDQVRSFLSSAGPTALFDLPWMPFYIAICFLFHFWIGVTALLGAVILFGLTLLAELLTKRPTHLASGHAATRSALAESTRRNVDVLQAMGFGDRFAERWSQINADYLHAHAKASDVAGTLGTTSKILRMMLQSGMLAIGAYLVIQKEATGGIMIASSIMMGRALAPVELAIGHWKGFVFARQSWSRLTQLLSIFKEEQTTLVLPQPNASISVQGVSISPPGDRKLVVRDATFALSAGDGLGIIGPSASGKSSLARALVGIWLPAAGTVRLDGASLDQWSSGDLGKHIGYLPQDVQLFSGTIAENIARFDPQASGPAILDAATQAGVHDMIVHLANGYDTEVGEGGSALSAGQRQRVALARALYGNPFLVVLDEPNSNLDAEGEAALTKAIQAVRSRQGIAIVIAHRPSALASLDLVAVMASGRIQAFGPKSEILNKTTRQPQQPAALKVVAGAGEGDL
ncbi:type I secretion system permease/ATPase [Mesorhizobium sp. 1M-11]|uniref:type I secretion system permease/ATPase n=1 Tax=Mesorhizobium sp. 1M-11 TaxID=1529006 RepID=UPI000A9CA403|nr:type I secretion system permease/ATPase [Mesorhizobium sp. 1M-11]